MVWQPVSAIEQADPVRDRQQAALDEAVVGQPFGGDQQYVELVAAQSYFDPFPIGLVRRVNGLRPDTDVSGGGDLVPHQ